MGAEKLKYYPVVEIGLKSGNVLRIILALEGRELPVRNADEIADEIAHGKWEKLRKLLSGGDDFIDLVGVPCRTGDWLGVHDRVPSVLEYVTVRISDIAYIRVGLYRTYAY